MLKLKVSVVLNLCRGSEKGFGAQAAFGAQSKKQHLVLRQTLSNLPVDGVFSQHVTELEPGDVELPLIAAICGAAERVSLWFRAHEVATGNDLANYFETAFTYFVDYWKGKENEDIVKHLTSYPSKRSAPRPKARRISSALQRAKETAPTPTATTNNLTRSPIKQAPKRSIPPTPPKVSRAASEGGNGSINQARSSNRAVQDSMAPLLKKGNKPRSMPELPKTSAGRNRSGKQGGLSAVSPANQQQQYQSSIDVQLKVVAPPQHLRGKTVEVGPGGGPERPRTHGARWIQIAIGPSYHDSEDLLEAYDQAFISGEWNDPEDDMGAKRASVQLPTVPSSTELFGAGLGGAISVRSLDNDIDTDETSWWQSRYETVDPDFELEISEPEPDSDTEMGDEDRLKGPPTRLKNFDNADSTGADAPAPAKKDKLKRKQIKRVRKPAGQLYSRGAPKGIPSSLIEGEESGSLSDADDDNNSSSASSSSSGFNNREYVDEQHL